MRRPAGVPGGDRSRPAPGLRATWTPGDSATPEPPPKAPPPLADEDEDKDEDEDEDMEEDKEGGGGDACCQPSSRRESARSASLAIPRYLTYKGR